MKNMPRANHNSMIRLCILHPGCAWFWLSLGTVLFFFWGGVGVKTWLGVLEETPTRRRTNTLIPQKRSGGRRDSTSAYCAAAHGWTSQTKKHGSLTVTSKNRDKPEPPRLLGILESHKHQVPSGSRNSWGWSIFGGSMAHIAEGLRAQHGLRAVSDMPCVRLSILELLGLAACANLDQGLEPLLSLVPGDYVQGFGCVDVHRKSKSKTYSCLRLKGYENAATQVRKRITTGRKSQIQTKQLASTFKSQKHLAFGWSPPLFLLRAYDTHQYTQLSLQFNVLMGRSHDKTLGQLIAARWVTSPLLQFGTPLTE
ncbi:hypothetical protein DER45DRAFT_532260 [Fusarium avenaceum]|nr:hypothetical protein DER45DRAFT_532260 [Fusarium avenaceum]